MSYTIAVVNFKLPSNFDDAVELVNPLTEIDVEKIENIYQQFHDEVIKLFPCLCSLPDEEIDNGVWSDGPLIDNFSVKAPVIGFSYSKAEEALPVVGELALNMGLSILDWQAEQVYNP
ncbi:hypothetical protein [Motilimonas eburnea]|uniref:hypothetical protein n=1 Tax=Motilimonas eburnea TaxID=1737488 RepID=UPI001E3E8F04|nr:hypothetical protein [Motilimonas eburnea]MCE2573812.1 hypothetical protein [Motilimonas eburnea]